jgi:protein involved in polysaccharide export with SLBB domain
MLRRGLLWVSCVLLAAACGAPTPVRPGYPPPRNPPPPAPVVTPATPAARPPAAGPQAIAQTPAQVANALDASVYRLASGDTVHIEVLGEAELTVTPLIDPLGNISYPFLGQVPAAGLTLRQLEQKILVGLRSGYLRNPDVRASIAQYRPIYVSGQVRATGAYPYSIGLTVEKAITLAGGTTQFASTSRIYLQRAGATQDQREKVDTGTAVFPGDTIVVEERLF